MNTSTQVTPPAKAVAVTRNQLRTDYANSRFLIHIHRLRALAILCIVTVHCTSFFDWTRHPNVQSFLNDAFDNSTILFVFISGFLFHHLSRSFSYEKYLFTKICNVGLPYVVAATPAIIYALASGDVVSKYPELAGHSTLYVGGWLLVNSGAHLNYALWFMPVIFIYYFLAPLFRLFHKHTHLYLLLALLLPLSLFGHRPTYEHGHNFLLALYFLPTYLLGMFFSQFRSEFEPFLDKHCLALGVLYLTFLLGHYAFSSHHGKYTVDAFFSFRYGVIDWLFVQQILMSIALYTALKKLDYMDLPVLDYLGEVSFTIYFVHMYVLYLLKHLTHYVHLSANALNFPLLIAIAVGTSCLIAFMVRNIFGKYSRFVLGS